MALYRSAKWAAVSCAIILCAPLAAMAAANVEAPLNISTSVSATATADGCFHNPGPFITIGGKLTLKSGLKGRLIFQNNAKGTHQTSDDVTVDVVIVQKGDVPFTFAKQPPQGGVGGNPLIFLQVNDSPLILLGRCVQGLKPASLDLLLSSVGEATVTAGACFNNSPDITLVGELILGGIKGKLIFSNNAKLTHNTLNNPDNVIVEFVILEPGQKIQIPKSPAQGGVGGNPLIYFQFIDGDDKPLSDKFLLGRCNKIGD